MGWVLYDLANTIFSFVVVTRYFNDWIIDERGQPDYAVGLMTGAVSIALLFTLPLIGARADRTGRHMPVLMAFTALSVLATAALGVVEPVIAALAIGGLATFAFNVADSQYHPLLATVCPDETRRGRVSGTGVALGFIGSLLALVVLGVLVDDGHAQRAFLPAAAMFGVFALPCFLLVRETPRPPAPHTPGRPVAALVTSVRRARGEPYGRLLLARFFYVDAIATVIQFMTVYARRTGDFDGNKLDALLAVGIVAAIAGALVAGVVAERVGPRLVVLWTLGLTVTVLIVGAGTGSSAAIWVLGPMVGIALGSLSAVDRLFLLRLVPAERRGEEFGLYALVGQALQRLRAARAVGRDRVRRHRARSVEVRRQPRRGRRARRQRPARGGDPAPA